MAAFKNEHRVRSDTYDALIGRRLREARNAAGLTQSALGKRVGLTFQQIQKHENGVVRISSGRLYALAIALETPLSYFFNGIDPDAPESIANDDGRLDLSEVCDVKVACIERIIDAADAETQKLAQYLDYFMVEEIKA